MSTSTAYHNRSISPQEQALYDHWLSCVETESPEQLIERFQTLFIDGTGYPHRDVVLALDEILASKEMEDYFQYVLNRCCHILINRWQARSQCQSAIPQLIALFEQEPSSKRAEFSRSRQVRNLHRVVSRFVHTEQYLTLKRLARLLEQPEQSVADKNQPLGTLIQRYPYLYEHCLVNDDSPEELQDNIRRIQTKAQHEFEVNLSHYVTYRVRRAQARRQGGDNKLIHLRPVPNPTLLSDRELVTSINQFSGKVDQGRTYRDSAQIFIQRNQAITFGGFKRELYVYLSGTIPTSNGSSKFNASLSQHLNQTLAQNDHQPLNDFLMVRSLSQLLNFLVVESPAHPQHFVFIDLINNFGPILTTSLLLKLALICRKIKPYLERRFSILFNHYETATQGTVDWLVKMLENLNVAFSLNFGSVDIALPS